MAGNSHSRTSGAARAAVPLALAAALAAPSVVFADSLFLKVEGVEGESADAKHKNEIDVLAWSWNLSRSVAVQAGTGRDPGKVTVNDIKIVKFVDKSTTELMQKLALGQSIPKVNLTIRRDGEKAVEYVKIEMKNVIISKISQGSAGTDERQTETIALNFTEVKVTYTPQDDKGAPGASKQFSYNLTKSTKN